MDAYPEGPMNTLNGSSTRFEFPATTLPVKAMAMVLTVVLLTCAVVGVQAFVVVPGLAGSTAELRREREQEAERLRTLEAVRQRQVMLEAELILAQERNLKLAKQLTAILESQE